MRKMIICSTVLVFALSLGIGSAFGELTDIEMLGKKLFFDENLSIRLNQSCATCHDPETGFTGPNSDINEGPAIYPGSIHTKAGNRKPPTAAYGGESPVLFEDTNEDECFFTGGMFWDCRATGENLGDPLAEQALGPFLNFLEQANPKAKLVCLKVKLLSDYADLFEEVWGQESLDCVKDLDGTYERIGRSIAAYERSSEVNPFDSKFDAFVAEQKMIDPNFDVNIFGIQVIDVGGNDFRKYVGPPANIDSDHFTPEEANGLAIFNADSYTQLGINPPQGDNGGFCYACHLTEGDQPLFTDFTYDNLGIPKNSQNPFYDAVKKYNPDGEDWIDPGLGGFLATREDYSACAADNYGKHKVPTLRNVDKRPLVPADFVKAYGHNGYFKSLEDIVNFYNTRDSATWPEPEVADNVNTDELGNLGLSAQQEEDLVAFMKTLSDGYVPPSP